MFALIRSEWKFLLFGFLMTFFSSPGQTFFISLFSGEIRGELNLTDGEFGGLYSFATLMSAIVMVWSGSLMDRVDLKKFSIAAVSGLAVGCVMISWSTNVFLLVLGIFLLRQMGQGLMCLASSTAMVRYLNAHKGKSNALAGMGYAVSEAVMPSVIVGLIVWLGWRQSWLVVSVMLIVLMVPIIIILLRNHSQRHDNYLEEMEAQEQVSSRVEEFLDTDDSPSRQKHWTRGEVLKDKCFYLFAPGLMSQQLMFTGFIFHQIHLVESKGWALSAWASLFAVYALVSVATKFIVGILVDRYGAVKMVPLVGLPMGIGLLILATTSSLFWGGVFLVLTGITVGFQSTVSAPFWAELYGLKNLGSIKSMGAAIMVLFTALSPVILGLLIDRGVSIESLAMGAAIYIAVTSALAFYAYLLSLRRLP